MWPWGHLALGYLLYSLGRRLTGRAPPTDAAALWLAVGTQFPDLVDKPLAWTFGLIPNGRSLTHSALSATLLVGIVLYVARRRDRSAWGWAFAAGYYAHLLGDTAGPLVGGTPSELAFLLWPVLPAIDYGGGGFLAHLLALEFTPLFLAQTALVLPAALLWVADGTPGTALLTWVRHRVAVRSE